MRGRYHPQFAQANRDRTTKAAPTQTQHIRTSLKTLNGNAPPHILHAAQLRLDHPTASYTELGHLAGLTKDTISGRIRQLHLLANRTANP